MFTLKWIVKWIMGVFVISRNLLAIDLKEQKKKKNETKQLST